MKQNIFQNAIFKMVATFRNLTVLSLDQVIMFAGEFAMNQYNLSCHTKQ